MTRPLQRLCALVSLVCFLGAGVAFGREVWLWGKGLVAERLIDQAWAETRRDGRPHAPWSWADFTPVAKLEAPRLGIERTVLSQSAGSALAFGLGQVAGSAIPQIVIAGHRDTWAAFLGKLSPGDLLVLETPGGSRTYRVDALDVVDEADTALLDAPGEDRLILLTCWPFGALRRGPLRLAVRATPLPEEQSADR